MSPEQTTTIEIPDDATYIERRNALLKDVKPEIIQKAWFTSSHLLLNEGSKVLDMGCSDGEMTYAMAALNPHLSFTGVDKSKRDVNRAKIKYELDNLDFVYGNISNELFEKESFDAIINSFILHEIYSASRYNEDIVAQTLHTHFDILKTGGTLFIRDYARPPPNEFVMLELPDKPSKGDTLTKLSDADLLLWYSENARPRSDPGTGGFFLEEMPQRLPNTRLFRLPFKWAYEFIMRKDDRDKWEKELPLEYTFFTPQDFRKELRRLGARVQYAAPHWDEEYIEARFERKFRLLDDNGVNLGYPPTSFLVVARKMKERKSLHIHERRPSQTDDLSIKITAVRNTQTGEITDIVSRDISISEVIPYRVDEHNRLKIYMHDGAPRTLANAVPRNGESFDKRRWSGHMIEPISINNAFIPMPQDIDVKTSALFAKDCLGLMPENNSLLEVGPDYLPAADYIDESINTFYLKVRKASGDIIPKSLAEDSLHFQARGRYREMDAQQVLNAITVGMIPSGRLELQILSLFNHVEIKPENWMVKQITLQKNKIKQDTSLAKALKKGGGKHTLFKDVKGTAGQLRPVHSIFVEDGQSRGAITGLTAQDMDFVVHDDRTVNTAVVIPLAKDLKNEVQAGFLLKQLPIPERHGDSADIIDAPSFDLPRSVTNIQHAKKYIADKFGVIPELVIKMGESYFTHIGMTQHRIHPFAVTLPQGKSGGPGSKFLPWKIIAGASKGLKKSTHFMVILARSYKAFSDEMRLQIKQETKLLMKQEGAKSRQEWSLPLDYEPAPLPKVVRDIYHRH